jgi:hypothetical protein
MYKFNFKQKLIDDKKVVTVKDKYGKEFPVYISTNLQKIPINEAQRFQVMEYFKEDEIEINKLVKLSEYNFNVVETNKKIIHYNDLTLYRYMGDVDYSESDVRNH